MDNPQIKQKMTQVDEQSEFLEKSLSQLSDALLALESRLERVLRSPEPQDVKEGVEIQLVPFADFLRSKAWAVHGIRNRIDSILERLEF